MRPRGGSRARIAAQVGAAFGVAALMPNGGRSAIGFALSPAGLAVAGIAVALAGEGIEESGTARRIRLGLGLRLLGAAMLAVAAIAVGLGGVGQGAGGFGAILVMLGLGGTLFFATRDLKVLGDLRAGQRLSLRKVGESSLDLEAAGVAVRLPLAAIAGVALGATTTTRGLMIAVEADARIEGPASELPWTEERVRSRTFFLDEYQLGGDALELAQRIAEAKARERGGYR
jgi:hypothetical protein